VIGIEMHSSNAAKPREMGDNLPVVELRNPCQKIENSRVRAMQAEREDYEADRDLGGSFAAGVFHGLGAGTGFL
jgi:hypothetical protein